MSLVEESYLQCLLSECEADFGREEKELQLAVVRKLNQIQRVLRRNPKQTFTDFSLETIVRFMEFSVEVDEKFASADHFVSLFFQRVTAPSQFYIRALLVKAKLITYKGHKNQLKGEAMILTLKESILEINKALDLISGPNEPAQKGKDPKGGNTDSNKTKYAFLIYNASTCLYNIIRFMLRQNWQKNFTQIIQRIYKLFQEIDQPDHNWKCRFMLILFQCLYDSDKKPDAWKVLDSLWQKAKSKNVDFLDSLFRLRVHYSKQNNALSNVIKKDVEGADPNGWKILQVLQRMKSGAVPQAQIQKQLMGVVNQISLGVLSNNEQSANIILSPVMQERLGEAGRIALKFNIINIANSITNFLAKARKPNQKAMVLNQYNKAELLIKKKNQFVDKKTGMMMNAAQIKQLEIERRKQALKILQKVMLANKKLDNQDLIYEGVILIWNISLPFLCPQYRQCVAKTFELSCNLLEQIDSTDHDLRTKMHLELAKIYFGSEKMFLQVSHHITKAMKLDHSIPSNKVQQKFEVQEDPSLYYRPFQRYLHNFREKILLKTVQMIDSDRSQINKVLNDLWNVAQQKSEAAKIDTLNRCLKTLMNLQQAKFVVDPARMLVDEQIQQEKILFDQKKLREYKKRKILAYEIAELSFQWEMNEFAKKASKFVLEDKWEAKNSIQLVIVQARCCYFLAQIQIDQLLQQNFEVPYTDPVLYNSDEQNPQQITEEKRKQVDKKKDSIFQYLAKGLELSQSIQQHWLVFNGAIYIWNNFLHVFRNPVNDPRLHKDLCQLLKKFFQSMKNSLKQIQNKGIVYYDLDTKIQTLANIGLIYARQMQNQKQPDEVIKVCEALLVTPLSPHTRKLVNSMKARVSGGGKTGAGKEQKKGGKEVVQQKSGGYSDSFLFDIFSQLQIIQNSTNRAQIETLIKKCFENLQNWQPKQKDEAELQLHGQLWARLARLALNQANVTMYKYALRCAEYSLSLLEADKNVSLIPSNRLRWYSLSQFLYSDCLLKIANPETQDVQSYQKLLFAALCHAVEAAHKGYKSNINILVVDGAKQVWNICSKLQDSQKSRAKLIDPIKAVLYYLKEMKQENQVDLILLLAQLFFKTANQNNQSKIGEEVADMLFSIVPPNMQKTLWEAKMIFMSKQGKNQLQAISNMKEADPSLQSKLWVKLARIANNPKKQHAAYNKAIQILKKENSIQIVEVLIQYSEWQLRIGNQKINNVIWNLLLASDFLIDIEYGDQDEDEDDEEGDKGTVFSRSTRGKKSHTSKSMKSSMQSSKVNKKNLQKKGPNSIKSKNGSNISRMNRSGRVAKATKSKNSKSIFSERQEDPNPQFLNCIHFERLFRIHTILSMISDNVISRIQYALDAKQFLVRILQISLNTINQIQQNTLKFSDKGKKPEESKLKMPTTLQEWVNFQLSKQLLQKVKTLQDPNFMGSYTFQKPELTFAYLKNLSQILNAYGLNFHTIPVYVLQKFIALEILNNKNYSEVAQLQMRLALKKIGYYDENKPNATEANTQKYNMSELQLKMEMIKTQSKVVVQQFDPNIFQSLQPPNLVQLLTNHEAWFELGKLLINFGHIYHAKMYLKEANKHFVALGNSQKAGECCIELMVIASMQGQNQQAMEYALSANKLCKLTKNWRKLLSNSCRLLLFLRKYQDISSFAIKVYTTVEQLIGSLNKQNSQKLMFESQIIQLKDILTLIQIIDLEVRFTESYQQQIANPVKGILSAVKQIEERVGNGDLWVLDNYIYFHQVSQKIVDFFIFGKQKGSHIHKAVFERTFGLLLKIQKRLFELMKYTLVGAGQEFRNNQLIHIYTQYRYLIANAYAYEGSLSVAGGVTPLEDEEDEDKDQVMELASINDDNIKKYIETLNLEIMRKMRPVPENLSPVQSSISVLENIRANIDSQSYSIIQWSAYESRALTLRARVTGKMDKIWSNDQPSESSSIEDDDEESEYVISSLEFMADFLEDKMQQKLLQFSRNTKCFKIAQLLYESFIENTGQQMNDKCFEFICKLQHSSYISKALDLIIKNLDPSHRFNSFLKLIENTKMDETKIKSILSSQKIFSSLSQFQKYQECLQLVPRNSVYVVIQLNLNLSEIYCGILTNDKNQQEYQINTQVLKSKLQKTQFSTYCLLKQKLNKIKKQISYFAYSDAKKMQDLLEQKDKTVKQIHQKFTKLSKWWLDVVLSVINKVKQVQAPVEVDKNKKGTKDTKKKGGKDQVTGYQSPLGASPAGYQSLVFLVDDFFEDFGFHLLPGLQSIPAISYDSSIFFLSRKMQSMSFKPEANNSSGFGADKGKFISYEFKKTEKGFKAISAQIIRQSPNLKIDGVCSSVRIPCIGDYKKYISEPGYLQLYGSLDLLNHTKLPLWLQNCGTAKVKLLVVCDHLNYEKDLINKFIPLDQENQSNSINEQTRLWKLVSDLLDVNLIKNMWSSSKTENKNNVLNLYKNLGSGYYLGACLNNKEVSRRIIERIAYKVHGCPVLRI